MTFEDAAVAARVVVALVLVASGVGKLVGIARDLRLLADAGAGLAALAIAIALPAIEIATAALLLAVDGTWPVALAVALLVLFTTVIALRLAREDRRPCNCFGPASAREPLSSLTLVRNGWFLALAVVATGASSLHDPSDPSTTLALGTALGVISGALIART